LLRHTGTIVRVICSVIDDQRAGAQCIIEAGDGIL
jgi:hypothetical protein